MGGARPPFVTGPAGEEAYAAIEARIVKRDLELEATIVEKYVRGGAGARRARSSPVGGGRVEGILVSCVRSCFAVAGAL